MSGAVRAHTPTMDLTRRLATVTLDGARGTRIGTEAQRRACRGAGAHRRRAHRRTGRRRRHAYSNAPSQYTKDRVQFGRPIGSFQALKHRMADLHVLVEAARSASYAAVEGAVSAAAAKVYCSEAFCRVAGEGIQLHGGIAITWEHDAQLYFKRAHGSAQLFGSPAAQLRRVEAAVGL